MSTLLAIDPGNRESAYVVITTEDCWPMSFGKVPNDELLGLLANAYSEWRIDRAVIEMVASYGMAVGADVFETCVAIGRFTQALAFHGIVAEPIKRLPVKVHHCHSAKAKDSNIRQALVDRFAPGEANHGKGTALRPGWFYGFKADIWAAYALAVYAADTTERPEEDR